MIRNNRTLMAFAYFVLLATFNAVVFLLDPLKTATFWTAYGFITGAFVIKIVTFFIQNGLYNYIYLYHFNKIIYKYNKQNYSF